MANFPFPRSRVEFSFDATPKEVEELAKEIKEIMDMGDSRPEPSEQPNGYIHNIGASMSPNLKKLFMMILSQSSVDLASH